MRLVLINPGPVDTPFWLRARTPDGRADALGSPLTEARRRGGVLSRPSLLTKLRTGSR